VADVFAELEALDQESAGDPFKELEVLDQEKPALQSMEPAAEEPWWKQAASAAGRQAGLTGRAVAQGVASLPMMAMDAGVAGRNLVTNLARGEMPTWADFNPFATTGGSRMEYELPSRTFDRALTESGVPVPRTATEKVAGFVQSVLAGSRISAPQAAKQPPAGFVPPAANPNAAVLKEAREAGYVVPPASTSQSVAAKGIESLAGKASTAQAASIKNQQVTNELVRKALGLGKDKPITPGALDELRETAGKVYETIADSGDIVPDTQFLDDLTQLGKGADDIASAFPGANVGATKQIGELVDSLLQDKFSSKAALQYLRELRKQAGGNLSGINAADPAKQALGMAQREAASTLEGMIGRHLAQQGKPELAQSFEQARRLIAMSHSVEKALNETTGNVAAGKLTQQMAKGKPLSGELAVAARFAQAFPKASKEITESMPGASPLDWMAAIATTIGTAHPAGLAVVGARPAARWAALSPMAQRTLLEGAEPYAAPSTIGLLPSAALQTEQP
jgi:hypothetical protein